MELNERETLIKVEQRLQDSVDNIRQMALDLKEIFGRLEKESKIMTTTKGELKTFIETASIRLSEIEKKLYKLDTKLDEIEDTINNEKAECIKLIIDEKQARTKAFSEEIKERELFETNLKSSGKTILLIFSVLASIATIISGILLFIQITNKVAP